MDYKTLILEAKSVRDFKKTEIGHDELEEIKLYSNNCKKLVPEIAMNVEIMSNAQVFEKINTVAGYLGHMIDAPNYLFVFSEVKDNYIENSGYIGEDLILKATEIGVSSCWITFEDSGVIKEKLGISSSKEITAIIALGYNDAEGKTKVINPTKFGENYSKSNMEVVPLKSSASRLAVEEIVFIKEWGIKAEAEELENRGLFDAFHFAGLAPSTLNRQPWRFIVDDGKVILAVRDDEHTNTYEEKIDAGIVMHHFASIVGATLFELNWKLEKPSKQYNIPEDYVVVGYCNV